LDLHIRIVHLNENKLQMHYFAPTVGYALESRSSCTSKNEDGLKQMWNNRERLSWGVGPTRTFQVRN